MKSVGIAGAGLIGRILALELAERGWRVTLFDKDNEDARSSCTYASAGMLAPSCELESAETDVAVHGAESLQRWPALLKRLSTKVFYRHDGSLVLAHPRDEAELSRLRERIESRSPSKDVFKTVTGNELRTLEPSLGNRFSHGLYIPQEAHVDNREAMEALRCQLHTLGATWQCGQEVTGLKPHRIQCGEQAWEFDWVIDTRGMGAKKDLADLRGVRGELLYIEAPEVKLQRPIRVMHPRYPIYVVPRANNIYVVGATAIESEDDRDITVRSTLELLSAAYAVHTGFAEGRLIETVTSCRPAFPDNRPRILYRNGLMRINGLYRHGFLLSPTIAAHAVAYLERDGNEPNTHPFMVEMAA